LWLNLAFYIWQRRRDFDIVHSHGAYYTHAFIGPLGRMTGLRSLVKASLANDDLLDIDLPLIGKLHRTMLRRIDAYVGISLDLVEEFRAGGLDPSRIHHIPNGVDTTRFKPCPVQQRPALREMLGLPLDRPIVLYVGVLDPRKNIEWLAEQWVKHNAFGTRGLLLAVGPQSREDPDGALRGRLADLGRSHPEIFALRDFAADILPYYQCVDALVLPSLKEGLPNVVLEAMACGLPCVAARASGSRELIREGETGYTYAHGDVAEMAEAVRRCISDEGARLGPKAHEVAESHYSIRAIADRYETLYERLLD
jgi:glycosyltransferase involved in cell wall biosynthesis